MAPKKAAKKAAKKHAGGHDTERFAKDTRRSYEHLGRVEAIATLIEGEFLASVHELAGLARTALSANAPKDAADLLRAAEHLCFGSMFSKKNTDHSLAKDLETALKDECQHLFERAADHEAHGDIPPAVRTISHLMHQSSKAALNAKNYRCTLEMARGAEALAHVCVHSKALPGPPARKQLA